MKKNIRVKVIFTCHNRISKTKRCIESLTKCNPEIYFSFIVVEDNSTDGTMELLETLRGQGEDLHIIHGTGTWYYSGAMREGMLYALANLEKDIRYVLLVNDDVEFIENTIEKMIFQSIEQNDSVIIGNTYDSNGKLSYGAIKYVKGYHYYLMGTENWDKRADSGNGNCVLLPVESFRLAGAMDSKYIHTLGDFDYGLTMKRLGIMSYPSRDYVGICDDTICKDDWTNRNFTIMERIKKKEDIKGAPAPQWFYFLRKHFGIYWAIRGVVSPFIRIVLGL